MCTKRWFNWDDLSRNPHCVCFCSMGWGPWKAKVKIPRAPTFLSCFNICEAQGVPQNGMSNQTHSANVCLNLCGLVPDLPRPFPEEEKDMFGALQSRGVQGCKKGREKRRRALGESRWDELLAGGFPLSLSLSPSLSSLPRRESS